MIVIFSFHFSGFIIFKYGTYNREQFDAVECMMHFDYTSTYTTGALQLTTFLRYFHIKEFYKLHPTELDCSDAFHTLLHFSIFKLQKCSRT